LAPFAGCGAHKTPKKHAAGHCLRDNIIPWASIRISALLNVLLGALRQQQQKSASTFALNWHFLRVAGRTRRQKHTGGHYLRDNLTTWASMLISALLDVPLGRPARPPRGLRQLLPLQGLNGDGNRERAAGRTATEHSPGWMSRGPRCLPMSRASRAVLRTHCRATSSIASTAARIKWRWEQGAHSRAHRPRAPPRLDVSGSLMPTNVPRVPSRPAHVLPSGDLLCAMPAPMNHVKYLRVGPRRNAFSKLVHHQYKSFEADRFCQNQIKYTTGLSNKPSNA